jgi:hypothetical protein
MLWTGAVGVDGSSAYLSTLRPPHDVVTRINMGTCKIEHRARCSRFDFTIPGWNSPFGPEVGKSGESSSRGRRRYIACWRPLILDNRFDRARPVACFALSDPAPRRAVRRVGPRPDPTRSARIDEPGGTAIRPGDRYRGPASPSRVQRSVAGRRRTAACRPRPRKVRVWDGRLATTRRLFRFQGVGSSAENSPSPR